MNNSQSRMLAVIMTLGLASCATLNDHTQDQKVTRVGNETVITWPADQKHVYLKEKDSARQLCTSTGPDFAIASSAGGSVGVGGSTGDSLGANAGQADLSLGGRSPSVLIVRDLLYRSCELTMNISASAEKAEEIFFKTLEVVKVVVNTQTEPGVSSATVSQSSFGATPPDTGTESDDDGSDDSEDEN